MHTIVFRYLHFFCVAVLFENVSCDQIKLSDHMDDLQLYRRVGCAAECIQNDINKTLSNCYKQCDTLKANQAIEELKPALNAEVNVTLICRDDTSLVIRLTTVAETYNAIGGKEVTTGRFTSKLPRSLYIIKASETPSYTPKIHLYISDTPIVRLKSLLSNTTYNISASVVNAQLRYGHARHNSLLRTLEEGYQPGLVKNVSFDKFQPNEKKTGLNVVVRWLPAEDATCSVEFSIYSVSTDIPAIDHDPKAIRDLDSLYHYMIKDLSFNGNYCIGLETKNNRAHNQQSNVSNTYLQTPTCLDFHNNNLTICRPRKPENVSMVLTIATTDTYHMNISWVPPSHNPDNYTIVVKWNDGKERVFNLTGDRNQLYVPDIQLDGHITAFVTASSPGGSSTVVAQEKFSDTIAEISQRYVSLQKTLIFGSLLLVMCVCCIVAVLLVRHRSAKQNRELGRQQYFTGLDKNDPGDPEPSIDYKENLVARIKALQLDVDATAYYHYMELSPSSIVLGKVIGQGAFGLVRKAALEPDNTPVAVKTMRDCPTVEDMTAFYREIEVMKSVPKHPNIVGIIGHYTKDVREMMLVTEYCDRGNLLHVLQNVYQQLSRLSRNAIPQPLPRLSSSIIDKSKSKESPLNFDSSMNAKTAMRYKYLNHNLDGQKPPGYVVVNEASQVTTQPYATSSAPVSPKVNNLVVNKLYDISSKADNSKLCDSTCKCDVEIVPGTEGHGIFIKIKDCHCGQRLNHNNNNSHSIHNYNHTHEQSLSPNMVDNPGYMDNAIPSVPVTVNTSSETDTEDLQISSSDLLDFAVQVANGMKFLSLNKVVHRDLAARNVLVCSDKTVKISDFGLSRDVYQDNVYQKTGGGKLPIKWMAIESLLRRTYTSQSDVWSYGILLYEIVTLGSSPYPSIAKNEDLLKHLQEQKRMDQPSTCSNELFNLMQSCWAYEPSDRPTFSDVHAKLMALTAFDDGTVEHIFIGNNLTQIHVKPTSANVAGAVVSPISSDDSSYLQPIQT